MWRAWTQTRSVGGLSPLVLSPCASATSLPFLLVVFLERLEVGENGESAPLPHTHVDHLGSVYALTHTPNAELRLRFYQVALRFEGSPSSAVRAYAQAAAQWVVGTDETGVVKGRMKFCRPIFRAVAAVDRGLAVRTYEAHKAAFHPIARSLIEKVCFLRRGGRSGD